MAPRLQVDAWMRRAGPWLLVAVTLSGRAAAQGPRDGPPSLPTVRLADVVRVLVTHSPALALARADTVIARADEQAVSGQDDWVVSAGGQLSRTDEIEGRAGRITLGRSLPTGGSLQLSAGARRQGGGAPAGAEARVELNHPLARGFGPKVARARRAKAKLAVGAATLRARQTAIQTLAEALRAYWELVYAAAELEARQASLTLAREQMEETRILVRQGARAPGELKAAEYGVRVREESLVLAYLALEERSLELRHVVGLETGPAGNASLPLWPGDRGDARAARPPVGAAVARGLERNPALALLALGEESADLDVRVARDGLRPRLDLSLSAGVGGDAPTVDGAVSSLGDQPADLFAGLTFSIELGRNTAQGASTSAAARKRKLRIELEEQRRRIGGSIVVAVHRVEAAQTRIQVTAQAVELALANLDTERARFRAGKTTSFEVLQRQDELDRARLSRARAASDHHQALVTLGALTGDLLEQYGVAVIE